VVLSGTKKRVQGAATCCKLPAVVRRMTSLGFVSLVHVFLLGVGCSHGEQANGSVDDVFSPETFAEPPTEFGPQARWWWPGGAVDDAILGEELRQFAELGYSAVEIQPFMATMTSADLQENSKIRTVGEASFLDRLGTAACAARDLGLAWDLTLGSGWSTGGPQVGDDGARQLLAAELTLTGPGSYDGPLPAAEAPAWIDRTNAILPAIDGFDSTTRLVSVLAAEVLDEPNGAPTVLGDPLDLASHLDGRTLSWEVPPGTHRVFAIYENRTQHYPVGNAYAGALEAARIIDHLDRKGIDAFLEQQFGAWIDAVAECPPRAVFVDSFELVGELPWTSAFAAKFESRMGYDIMAMLPFLFLDGGESEYANIFGRGLARYRSSDERGARAREDYEAFRGTLFADELIGVLRGWLGERGIELRLQAHGGYADVLDAYAMADVPESEGLYAGGSYDFLRLAASAAEVLGQRFASSETFVSIGARELSEVDARLLMGRAFSAGINRLMHHGHTYPYLHTDGQRWYPFHPLPDSTVATGPLDLSFDLHPGAEVWGLLPTLNRMAARLGYALSRGSARAEVAWLYPEWEVENFTNFGVEPGAFESEISRALRRAGLSYTRVSRAALAGASSRGGSLQVGEAFFRALVVSDVHAIDPEVLRAVQAAVDAGVPVVWIGDFPERADGLVDAETRDAAVAELVERSKSGVRLVSSAEEIPLAIANAGVLPPLRPVEADGLQLSVTHREIRGGDLYFLFNESYEARSERIRIAGSPGSVRLLDPETGESIGASIDENILTVTLAAARGVVLSVER